MTKLSICPSSPHTLHNKQTMKPVTYFEQDELDQAIEQMRELLVSCDVEMAPCVLFI
jgi:hypothetical protein